VSDPDGARAPDLVKRQFTAGAPNRLWVGVILSSRNDHCCDQL
jgi:hypothetical protein